MPELLKFFHAVHGSEVQCDQAVLPQRKYTYVVVYVAGYIADGWPDVVELFSVVGATPSPNQGVA